MIRKYTYISKASELSPDSCRKRRLPLPSIISTGVVEVTKLPARDRRWDLFFICEAVAGVREERLLSVVPACPAGTFDGVCVPEEFVPALGGGVSVRFLVRWKQGRMEGVMRNGNIPGIGGTHPHMTSSALGIRPRPGRTCSANNVSIRAVHKSAALLPSHGIVRSVNVAGVKN